MDSDFSEIFVKVFFGGAWLWCAICAISYVYKAFSADIIVLQYRDKTDHHEVAAFIGWMLIIGGGIETFLWMFTDVDTEDAIGSCASLAFPVTLMLFSTLKRMHVLKLYRSENPQPPKPLPFQEERK